MKSSQPVQYAAIIVAAGSGTRMDPQRKMDVPKVLYPLGQQPVLKWSVDAFAAYRRLNRIILVVHKDFIAEVERLKLPENLMVVAGGSSRGSSVRRGLAALSDMASEAIVAIHDGARPFISTALIEKTFSACEKHDAVTTALPVADTTCRSDVEGRLGEVVSRENLWLIQTPQVFRLALLRSAHELAENEQTDDAGLVKKLHPVHLLHGDRRNFKLTLPEDYKHAQFLVHPVA